VEKPHSRYKSATTDGGQRLQEIHSRRRPRLYYKRLLHQQRAAPILLILNGRDSNKE